MLSSKRLGRCLRRRPNAANSRSWYPRPSPSSNRPSVISEIATASSASRIGSCSAETMMLVPTRMVDVRAPSAAHIVNGEAR